MYLSIKKSSGFTLIEVLVAVVILTGGLLGLVALQATGLSNNQSAYNRSQATQLSYDIADRMRANASAVASYAVTEAALSAISCTDECKTCDSSGKACSPAQLANKDLLDWKNALISSFPNGKGSIQIANGFCSISVNWSENRDADSNGNSDVTTFVMSFQL